MWHGRLRILSVHCSGPDCCCGTPSVDGETPHGADATKKKKSVRSNLLWTWDPGFRCQAEGKVDSSPTLNFGWGQVPTTKFHYRPKRYKYTDRPLDFPNIALRPRQIILPSPPGDTQSPTSWRKTSMKNRPLNTNLQTPKRQLLDYASVTSQHPPKTNAHPNTGMISPYTHIHRQNPTNPHL